MMNNAINLGFGCASVMGKKSRRDSLKAMSHAFESGISHFDIARSYGFGQAESVLGEFLRGKRDSVTITSKFGVVPPELTVKHKFLIPVARKASELLPPLKQVLTKKSGQVLTQKNFDAGYGKRCLEVSLQQLKTECIDYYLLHEPCIDKLNNKDELYEFLESVKNEGKIKSYGVAVIDPKDANELLGFGNIIQFEGNLNTLQNFTEAKNLNSFSENFITRPFIGGASDGVASLVMKFNLKYEINLSATDFSMALSISMASGKSKIISSMFSLRHINQNVASFEKMIRNKRLCKTILDFAIEYISSTTERTL